LHSKSLSSDIVEKDGIKSVYERYDEGKRLMKDFVDFLKERISLEENYSKSILKLAKSPIEAKG
jgi:hypothetical protein